MKTNTMLSMVPANCSANTLFINKVFQVLLFLAFTSCMHHENAMKFVSFGTKKYAPTESTDIEIVTERRYIKHKYLEIGVLKITGSIDEDTIRTEASKLGANAILFEANNVVLFKYLNYEKEKPVIY